MKAAPKRRKGPVPIFDITTILLRHASGPGPEVKLTIAVLTRAMADLRSASPTERESAERFVRSEQWDSVASFINIGGNFARDVARLGGWLH